MRAPLFPLFWWRIRRVPLPVRFYPFFVLLFWANRLSFDLAFYEPCCFSFLFLFFGLAFCHIYLFIFFPFIIVLSWYLFLLLSLVYTFLRIALSPAMNEDHECHDRVRPKVFLLFCFHFCGTWHPSQNRPTIQVKTGPWGRVCRLPYPWTVTFFVVVDAYLLAGENGVGGIFAKAFCSYIASNMLYIPIVFNSITWILTFLLLIVDYWNITWTIKKKKEETVNPDPALILSLEAGTGYPGDRSSCRVQPRTLYFLVTSVSILRSHPLFSR